MPIKNGEHLVLNFTNIYTPPIGSAVSLNFNETPDVPMGVGGFNSSLFGAASVVLNQRIKPVGFLATKFNGGFYDSKHRIEKEASRIKPSGWDDAIVNSPTYVSWRKFIYPPSFDFAGYVPIVGIRYPGGYQAAPGVNVVLNFGTPIAQPPGGNVVLEFGSEGYSKVLSASVGNSQAFGSPFIGQQTRVDAKGEESSQFGLGVIWTLRQVIYGVQGFDSQLFGQNRIEKNPVVNAISINQSVIGSHAIVNRNSYLYPSGFSPSVVGTQFISFYRRYLLQVGWSALGAGTNDIQHLTKYVTPNSIYTNFASAHKVGGTQFITPDGLDATKFGTRIIPESQTVYPAGFTNVFGEQVIWNYSQIAAPKGFLSGGVNEFLRWGTDTVYNLRQYIQQVFDAHNGLVPPAWSLWTEIYNRNRNITGIGFLSERLGFDANIYNNARVLAPVRIEPEADALDYKAGMISYRIRSVPIEGMEPPYISTWGVFYNKAELLKPSGYDTALFGAPSLVNTRRYYNNVGNIESGVLGYPMVADRIRYLDIETRYGINPPVIQLPEVKLQTRYIDAIGYDAYRSGNQNLEIHWTLITPRWTLQHFFGVADVWNLTPELKAFGKNTEEFGTAFVRLQWRSVLGQGSNTQLFGSSVIAFRDRSMTVTGFRAGAIGDKLTVVKTGAPPYSTQYIWLDVTEENTVGDGIYPPSEGPGQDGSQVPAPILNQQVIYVRQTEVETKFGSPICYANAIRVEPGYQELLVGSPIITNLVRTVSVSEGIKNEIVVGRPRLSPHTIYAVMEAPQQAKDNHPVANLHYVDGWGTTPGIVLGRPSIMNQHRDVKVTSGIGASTYGRPTFDLSMRYIEPTGFNVFRMGWHLLPGEQVIEQYDSSNTLAWGKPTVSRPIVIGPLTMKPTGFNSNVSGTQLIEFFNREVKPSGYFATLMGTRKTNDTPFMWQGLRIGPHIPNIPTGFDVSVFGTSWISHRVREVKTTGFDMFISEYDLEHFAKRMRVTQTIEAISSITITPEGFNGHLYGVPDVKPAIHYIKPDGNADQFRKGAF